MIGESNKKVEVRLCRVCRNEGCIDWALEKHSQGKTNRQIRDKRVILNESRSETDEIEESPES